MDKKLLQVFAVLAVTLFLAPRFLDNVAKWNLKHYSPSPICG